MIHVGLTTYERESYLQITARSLSISERSLNWSLHVYDDASPALTADRLRELFPFATSLTRRTQNLGADNNQHQVMCDFLLSADTHLLFLDGDLLINPDWQHRALYVLGQGVQVLSLYNSACHETVATVLMGSERLAEKRDLGGAGTIFSREVVLAIVRDVPPSRRFDWDWSHYLNQRQVPLYSLERSAVQHIGLSGTNSSYGNVDFGLGSLPDGAFNAEECVSFLERLLLAKSAEIAAIKRWVDETEELRRTRVSSVLRRPWLIPGKAYRRLRRVLASL